MSSPNPQPAVPKAGGYQNESSSFASFNDLFRFFQPLAIKVSKNSPPIATDLKEMQWTFDKTTLKLWIKVDGTARYVQFT